MAKQSLDKLAEQFMRKHPRQNPPDDEDVDELVQRFCIERKMAGQDLSTWDEQDWRSALAKIGVSEDLAPSYMEDVASWGVDD